MNPTEFFLYLIYGYAMITMGVFAVSQKDIKVINFSIVKSLKYLGYFGIINGISEWMIMIIKLDFHPDLYYYLSNASLIMRALAFTFLLYFGLDLLPLRDRIKKITLKLPVVFFVLYIGSFFFLCVSHGINYHLADTKHNVQLLYNIMGFPSCSLSLVSIYIIAWVSCIITAAALYVNAWLIEKTKSFKISTKYRNLAWVFIVYGFMEGLLVDKADFFPANLINKDLFVEYLAVTPLFVKAFVGFVIYFLLIRVIDTFSWEQEQKLNQLEKHKIASEERTKLGMGIHDSIIEELHEVGSKIESLYEDKDEDQKKIILKEIKNDLNKTISKTRDFISTNALDKIDLENLKDNLEQLTQNLNKSLKTKIDLECRISPYMAGYLSPEKSTLIYYIVQEAINNIIECCKADYVNVLLEGRYDFLYIIVEGNGKKACLKNLESEQKAGINSIKEKARRAGGWIELERVKKGVRIELRVPWEEAANE